MFGRSNGRSQCKRGGVCYAHQQTETSLSHQIPQHTNRDHQSWLVSWNGMGSHKALKVVSGNEPSDSELPFTIGVIRESVIWNSDFFGAADDKPTWSPPDMLMYQLLFALSTFGQTVLQYSHIKVRLSVDGATRHLSITFQWGKLYSWTEKE